MNEIQSLVIAAGVTLGLALCALLLGLVLAIFFSLWEASRWKIFAVLGTGLVTLLRGLPEILVVLFIYFSASWLLIMLIDGVSINLYLFELSIKINSNTVEISPFLCGVVALASLYAAYASQTLRGALQAIPRGQWESGQALGLSQKIIFFRLIMPQMWRHALPGLSNQWLVLLKDTALVALINVNDLMWQAGNIATRTQEPFTWYMVAAGIYLGITLLSQFIIKRIERRTTRFERSTT